jgi:hypothetical protein
LSTNIFEPLHTYCPKVSQKLLKASTNIWVVLWQKAREVKKFAKVAHLMNPYLKKKKSQKC